MSRPFCSRCGERYDGTTGHGPGFCGDGQLTIENVPHARNTDPWTSHASGRRTEDAEGKTTAIRPRTSKHLALLSISQVPRTANDVVRATGKRGIWKRVSDLKNAELIEAVGTRTDPDSDRPCLVWTLTETGHNVLLLLNRGETVRL